MNTTSHSSACKRAFTLIELLVVIAIIALLISIIVPVTSKALESSRRSACASNLRTLAQGLVVFAADHKGYFPDYEQNSNSWPWAGEWAVTRTNFYDDYVSDPRAYYCPSDLSRGPYSEGGKSKPYFPEKPPYALGWRRNISYCYFAGADAWKKDQAKKNPNIQSRFPDGNNRGGFENLGDISEPSSSTVIADLMRLGKNSVSAMSDPVTSNWNHPGKTYGDSGGHLAYADGHVSWFSLKGGLPDNFYRSSGSGKYVNEQPE
ncbi:prepilin-type N-terminal cleavage/methylation domain-containing protein [Kiritimatiellota bacterium B12222]|nr:prepilin-type N-terminal cleavage/methylation domain-containing protein [Kiritimatiellota bacterium B12222]